MPERQQTNSGNLRPKCSFACRIAAALIFVALAALTAVLWFSAKGTIHLGFWVGVCGFKQRYGLPCPGCGWTHAMELFVTGHPVQAFMIQPAAAFFCTAALAVGIYALLIVVFGIEFNFLSRLVKTVGITYLVVCAAIIILAGWMVTLLSAVMQGNGR